VLCRRKRLQPVLTPGYKKDVAGKSVVILRVAKDHDVSFCFSFHVVWRPPMRILAQLDSATFLK